MPVEVYLAAAALTFVVILVVILVADRLVAAGDADRFRAKLEGRPK